MSSVPLTNGHISRGNELVLLVPAFNFGHLSDHRSHQPLQRGDNLSAKNLANNISDHQTHQPQSPKCGVAAVARWKTLYIVKGFLWPPCLTLRSPVDCLELSNNFLLDRYSRRSAASREVPVGALTSCILSKRSVRLPCTPRVARSIASSADRCGVGQITITVVFCDSHVTMCHLLRKLPVL